MESWGTRGSFRLRPEPLPGLFAGVTWKLLRWADGGLLEPVSAVSQSSPGDLNMQHGRTEDDSSWIYLTPSNFSLLFLSVLGTIAQLNQ
jgi:hypothetical protein